MTTTHSTPPAPAETTVGQERRTAPRTTRPRITKEDRVALDAIHIATALPGNWTVGRGRHPDEVADLRCLNTGIRIGLQPWQHRAWGYHLVPGDVPRDLNAFFVWPREYQRNPDPGFAVGAPATEVATYIHEHLIPRYHQALARAETTKRERAATRAREQAARDQIAAQLERAFPPVANERSPQHVRIHYLGYDDLMRIQLTMPIDDAIARAPALAHALSAAADDTAALPTPHRS